MFSDIEMAVFMEELEEKLQVINDNVLLLERDGGTREVIQEIFRAAHTIKGSSGVMGYEKMSRLTHEIENLFDRLRQGALEVTPDLVDVLFEALDTLKFLKDEITGDVQSVEIDDVMAKLRACQQLDIEEAKPESSTSAVAGAPGNADQEPAIIDDVTMEVIRQAEAKGFQAYVLKVTVDAGCQMKNVRAYLVFEVLQQIGEIIKSDPPAEELQDGKYEDSFSLVLVSRDDQEQVKEIVMSIAEISSVDVYLIEAADDPVSNPIAGIETQAVDAVETPAKGKASAAAKAQESDKNTIKTVRVDVHKLDNLMNLVSELVIDRTRLNRFVELFEGKYTSEDLVESIVEISSHLGQITTDLQDEIMKARMLPVATVFDRMPRMVRDIARKLGREIDFIIEGKETELDRNVIELISDPLIHLIRNAVDHGIEPPEERVKLGKPRTGRIVLRASYVESHIVITLTDDGKGISAEKLKQIALNKGLVKQDVLDRMSEREAFNLIFMPGFSTAEVVSDVSGRGVGMDIVRTGIEQINGTVEYESAVGKGTKFIIRLPLTLVIVRALMVGMGNHIYAFPLSNVMETLAIKSSDIKLVQHSEVVVVRGSVLPLVRLADLFNEEAGDSSILYVVVLASAEKRVGVIVDRLIGEQEIVIKSLGKYLGNMAGLSGATILGDGRVALIIDAKGLIDANKEGLAYAN